MTKTIEEKTVRHGSLAVEVEKMKSQLPEAQRTLSLQTRSWLLSWMAVAPPKLQSERNNDAEELVDVHDTIELLNDDDNVELFKETLLAQLCGSRLQEHRFHQSPPRSLLQRSRQRAMTSTRGVEGVARLITEDRRRGRRARCVATSSMRGRRRRPHEDPVARHESKPSCRHVVSHTSKHAACKTHRTVLWSSPFGPTLSQRAAD